MRFNKLLLTFLAITISVVGHSQLLERESVDHKIVTGTRPVAGNFGYFIGPSLVELQEMVDDDLDIRGFPFMGIKYYFTDNIELRLSTQIYKKSEEYQGELVSQIGVEDNVEKESLIRFMPGVSYHFSKSNWLDTYAGLDLIFGSETDEILNTQKTSLNGDYFAEHLTKRTFDWGFNINFGLQAFVADLPLALGVETSIRSLKKSNLQYETSTSSSVEGIVTEQTYYQLSEASLLKYQSLKYKKHELGADLRFLITYYFRK